MSSELVRRGGSLAVAALLLALVACGSTVQLKPQAGQVVDDGLGGATNVSGGAAADGDAALGASGVTNPGGATGSGARAASGATATTAARVAAAIPPTGPGWDEKFVYIGVDTQKDVRQTAQTTGLTGLDAGDQEGQANAVVNQLNKRGGIFGRQIKIVFRDHSTTAMNQDADTVGAATCHYFTEDRPVIAVLNPVTLLDVPSFRACLANAHVFLWSASVQAVDAKVGQALAPYFVQAVAPTWDALAPALVQDLKAGGWFGGWNTSTGAPGNNPVKVGIITASDDVAIRVGNVIKNALAAAGYPDSITYQYSGTDMSPAVLQFSGKNVTHVISDDPALLAFLLPASSQKYHPRYGITSYNAPAPFLEESAPAGQLTGAAGVGWTPAFDVHAPRDPGPTGPGGVECLDWLKQGGQTFGDQRLALSVALAFCDGLKLLTEAAVAGHGLSGPAIAQGIQTLGRSFSTAFSFANGISPTRLFIPGAVRRIVWDDSCKCIRYPNTTNLPL